MGKSANERWARGRIGHPAKGGVEKRHTTEKFGKMGEGSMFPPADTFDWHSPPTGSAAAFDYLKTGISKDSGFMYGGSDAIAGHGEGEFFAEKARHMPTEQTKDLTQEIFDALNTPEAEQLGRDAQAGAKKFKVDVTGKTAIYGGIGETGRGNQYGGRA